jgi:AraC family transcriptional regulator, activator of mtrCDE
VRVEASFFGRIELGAPWGARLASSDALALHHVVEGEMWLALEGRDVRVEQGDLLLLPHGLPHCLRHAPDAAVVDLPQWMSAPPGGAQSVHRRLGGSGRRTVVLCATLRASGAARALLLRSLPAAVHIAGGQGEPVPGLERLLDGIRDEVRARRPGSSIMAARFAEVLLLQVIRAELERRAAARAWPTVLGDDHVGRALAALYEAPQRSWTVAALARRAGQSRSAFARAFREQVGESPLRHLTRWRIELAKEKLAAAPDVPIAEIALGVGYRSEAAFNVAFRREAGVPPGTYRRSSRPDAGGSA